MMAASTLSLIAGAMAYALLIANVVKRSMDVASYIVLAVALVASLVMALERACIERGPPPWK